MTTIANSIYDVVFKYLMEDRTAAMALTDRRIPLDDPALKTVDRPALIMGTEGHTASAARRL